MIGRRQPDLRAPATLSHAPRTAAVSNQSTHKYMS
jgi:hypothetical protein